MDRGCRKTAQSGTRIWKLSRKMNMTQSKPHTKHYPQHIDLEPVMHVEGTVRLPGSKSISNRTLLLAALSEGTTTIHDLLASDDTLVMLGALHALGIKWEQ